MASDGASNANPPIVTTKQIGDSNDLNTNSISTLQMTPPKNSINNESYLLWPLLQKIPFVVEASVPIMKFSVRDLLALKEGKIVQSIWNATADIPVNIGKVHLSLGEFEISDGKIALRLTILL